jgi:hypothetical protein
MGLASHTENLTGLHNLRAIIALAANRALPLA